MTNHIRRREFLTLLGGAAAAGPLTARAQQRAAVPVVGYLSSTLPAPSDGFRKGLQELGYVEGKNVAIEFRSGAGQYERLSALAADLLARRVNVICAIPTVAALAAKAATASIPIVFNVGGDPVATGLVTSLARPTANLTGVGRLASELGPKRLQLVHELVPKADMLAVLVNPKNPNVESDTQALRMAAEAHRHKLLVVKAGADSEFEPAFAALAKERPGALIVMADAYLSSQRYKIVAFTVRSAIPAIFPFRDYVTAGGLMSYDTGTAEMDRQQGVYTGRILRGAKVADLPVMLPTKFEFVLNLQTAKTLGIDIPPGVLAIADEVIE
jgi:putative tryptophan/tyrosine transport system substrate-binding protein